MKRGAEIPEFTQQTRQQSRPGISD